MLISVEQRNSECLSIIINRTSVASVSPLSSDVFRSYGGSGMSGADNIIAAFIYANHLLEEVPIFQRP